MKMKWLFLGVLFIAFQCQANSDFKQWMQQQSAGMKAQQRDFQQYKDNRDKEFSEFLKANWIAVDMVKQEKANKVPKPDVIPVATIKPHEALSAEKPIDIAVPEKYPATAPVVAPARILPSSQRLTVDFFGNKILFYYDNRLQKRLATGIDKNTISDYWSSLSQSNYDDLIDQLQSQYRSLLLNDWAYASLVYNLAAEINNNRANESMLLSWFLLVKSGYKARIAYNNTAVYLLAPAKQDLFEVTYFTYNNIRYYALGFDGKKHQPGAVYTYDSDYPDATRIFDMQLTSAVASTGQMERRHLTFDFEGKKYNIKASYDRGRVKFLSTYPQLDLQLYLESDVNKGSAIPLQKQMAEHMQDMTEQQAVNFLLRFVQTSFQYETDDEQFGKENYLFPEETLFYPYSDCEDRVILFTWLVQSLLKLDVIGLDYPGHVATAVLINGDVSGDGIMYKGKKYTIADPTYINASAGMSMPGYSQSKPKIITQHAVN